MHDILYRWTETTQVGLEHKKLFILSKIVLLLNERYFEHLSLCAIVKCLTSNIIRSSQIISALHSKSSSLPNQKQADASASRNFENTYNTAAHPNIRVYLAEKKSFMVLRFFCRSGRIKKHPWKKLFL